MLISQDSMEIPEGFEITPEIIQGIIQKYNDWAEGLRKSGHLVSLNKLREEPGKNIVGVGANQVVTDGPYAAFSVETARSGEKVARFGQEKLGQLITRLDGQQAPKGAMLDFTLAHEMYHRGQLTV